MSDELIGIDISSKEDKTAISFYDGENYQGLSGKPAEYVITLRSENERLTKELEEIKFALQVEEHDNKYNCNKIDKLEAENARLKGLYGIIDGQKIIIKELEDKVKELTEWKPTAPQIEGK